MIRSSKGQEEALAALESLDNAVEDLMALAGRNPTLRGRVEMRGIVRLLEKFGAPDSDAKLAKSALNSYLHGVPLGVDQGVALSRLLEKLHTDLERFHAAQLMHDEDLDMVSRGFIDDLRKDLRAGASPSISATARKALVKRTVYNLPGLYARQLYRRLRRDFAYDFTYETLLNDLADLSTQKKVLTIGGPRGVLKYCFPDPSRVQRQRYFGGIFGLEAIVQQRVIDPGEIHWRVPYLDFYRVNGITEPTVLAVRWGKTDLNERDHIHTFGMLRDFKSGAKLLGIVHPSAELKTRTMIIAQKIAVVQNGHEDEVLYDPSPLRPAA